VSLSDGQLPQLDLDLEDFGEPLSVLRRGDLVIFEDLQKLTEPVQETVNRHTHHLGLCATFLVCQGLMRTELFGLAQFIHNVILLLHSNSVARFANYLVTVFFFDPELRDHLRKILAHGQRHDHTVWLEVNSLAGKSSTHLALSAVEKLFGPREDDPLDGEDADCCEEEKNRRREEWQPFCIFFPQPHLARRLRERLDSCGPGATRLEMARRLTPEMKEAAASLVKAGDDFPEAFMLVPAERVCQEAEHCDRETEEAAGSEDGSLAPEDEADHDKRERQMQLEKWEQLTALVEREVEDTFDSKRWRPAKLLARQVLRNPEFGVSDDGQLLRFKTGDEEPVSLLDFLIQCTRPKAPSETGSSAQRFAPFVRSLLQHHMPESFVRNRSVLEAARRRSSGAKKRITRQKARRKRVPLQRRRARGGAGLGVDEDDDRDLFDDYGYPARTPATRFGSRPYPGYGGCSAHGADPCGGWGLGHRHPSFFSAF
jgi:hypothetical protein